MNAYNVERSKVLDELKVTQEKGLTDEQVASLKEEYGENKLEEKKHKSFMAKFFDQFKDVMIIILLVAVLFAMPEIGIAFFIRLLITYFIFLMIETTIGVQITKNGAKK